MILQALVDYYERKGNLPEEGFQLKEIPTILVIDPDGNPVNLYLTYEKQGKKEVAQPVLVPREVDRTSEDVANLFWDNPSYVLGVDADRDLETLKTRHRLFRERIEEYIGVPDSGIAAVLAFLKTENKAELLLPFGDVYRQVVEKKLLLTFQLLGVDNLVVESPEFLKAYKAWRAEREERGTRIRCLVCGKIDTLAVKNSSIKGVVGAQSSGAKLVSFNMSASESFGKKQGENAPVGESAMFAYTTALNHLLRYGSGQRIQVGDATTVFWGDKENQLEPLFPLFFTEPAKDSPDAGTKAVEALFDSIKTGRLQTQDGNKKFYVLGLSPNAARISVRFWIHDTVSQMAEKIALHFSDIAIVHGPKDHEWFSVWRVLVSTAPIGKTENISPSLAGSVCRSILEATPYPAVLFQAVVGRIKVEHEITHVRAAVVKACLNRQLRYSNLTQEKELTVSLDTTNANVGYRLGRLFAVLEQIQERANPGINATIRDKFYAGASATPSIVFPNLMRLKNHHLSKVSQPGFCISREKLIGEIANGISEFPAHLVLADQGRFAVGYYHQRQDFFTKKQND